MGNRRAQYVSIPLGPGVLSNTTGRGAKNRQNYMTWDRWKDATWVRWHKLLPEKQGGWAYQPLIAANQSNVIPGSPVLLLHFNGANGQTSTVDSSAYANTVSMNGAVASLSTANPKFGSAALNLPPFNPSNILVVAAPFALGTPLDVFALPAWTLEAQFYMTDNTLGNQLFIFNYGGAINNPEFNSFLVTAQGRGDGTTTVSADGTGMFGAGAITGANLALALNAWHHLALVCAPSGVHLYVDGVSVGFPLAPGFWTPAHYSNSNPSPAAIVGGFTQLGGTTLGGQIDEVRVTPLAIYTSNFTPPTAENTLGLPNIFGTPNPPSGTVPGVYLGAARDLHDWSSIDGQYWIALGTHLKLYVVNQGTLYDITPLRKTSNVTNALTTTNTSTTVTVVDPGHQAATGDFVDITSAIPVGGLTLAGTYQIVVVDPSTYTIVASSPASSGATGGGNFSIGYEIGTGLASNGQLLGYGTGLYGAGTYGTPRLVGQGVPARLRTWSLDNYGQDLVASPSDGAIYYWARNSGPNSRAQILANAPDGVQRVIVDAQQHVIIALGCTDVTSVFNAMLVRWCSFNNITDWVPTDINTAGDDLLTSGSRIITGLKTKGQNLIFTDITLYRMVFVGAPDIYDFVPAGQVTIVGPNAAVDVDGVAYFMGFDNIYNYSGTLNLQACDVWETVFDPNFSTSLLRSQAEKVVCFTYEPKTEVTWLYPSIGGQQAIVFTAGIAQGAVSATLAAPWTGATGVYLVTFGDQEGQYVSLAAGQTTATWLLPLTAAVAAQATVGGDCDRYVTFNWEDGTWYCGAWNRTCAQGRAPAMNGYPYGVNAGTLYQHEVGTDAVEPSGTVPLGFSMTSLDITVGGAKSEYTMGGSDARFAIGGSDAHLLVRSILPDWKYFTGQMNLTLFTKDRPQDTAYVQDGPVTFDATTGQIDIDAHGSQVVIQMDNNTNGGQPSLGCSFRMGIFQGLATPYAKR